jgi:hypothetical protein
MPITFPTNEALVSRAVIRRVKILYNNIACIEKAR